MTARPLLSLSMIVRNEERTLRRCLASVRAVVDEIVVVDTGSTDGTLEVAAEFGARPAHVTWRRDFAWARQQAMDRARGRWVMWLDADDVVEGIDGLRERLAQADPSIAGFSWKYVNARDEYGHSISECWRERCVRHDGRFQWAGTVHEVLSAREPATLVQDPHVVVVHRPEPRGPERSGRNLDLLLEQFAREGSAAPPRLLLYIGLELSQSGDPTQAVQFLRDFVARSSWQEQNYHAHLVIAAACRRLERFGEAIDAALSAVKLCPRMPEAYFSLGETAYFQRDWEAVVHWVDVGRHVPSRPTVCVANPMDVQYRWIIHYTNALFHLNRVDEALMWTNRALEICPRDAWHLANRAALEPLLRGAA
jgi:tetratricopeptide (TPR) repeat protein